MDTVIKISVNPGAPASGGNPTTPAIGGSPTRPATRVTPTPTEMLEGFRWIGKQAWKNADWNKEEELAKKFDKLMSKLSPVLGEMAASGMYNELNEHPSKLLFSDGDFLKKLGQFNEDIRSRAATPKERELVDEWMSEQDNLARVVGEMQAREMFKTPADDLRDNTASAAPQRTARRYSPDMALYSPQRGAGCNCHGLPGLFSLSDFRDLVNRILSWVFDGLGRFGIPLGGCMNGGINRMVMGLGLF